MRRPSKTALFAAAKRWDAAAVAAALAEAPELIHASDPQGRTALHLACAVKPGGAHLAEAHGLDTVTTLLGAGADLEGEVPMDEDEGDFPRDAALVRRRTRREPASGRDACEARRERKLLAVGRGMARRR